jgi:hypothetical protein
MALKKTKRQIGYAYGSNILGQIANLATGVRQLIEKGVGSDPRDPSGRTQIKIECAPEDIKKSWSPEQLAEVERFISVWSEELPSEPKRTEAIAAQPKRKR